LGWDHFPFAKFILSRSKSFRWFVNRKCIALFQREGSSLKAMQLFSFPIKRTECSINVFHFSIFLYQCQSQTHQVLCFAVQSSSCIGALYSQLSKRAKSPSSRVYSSSVGNYRSSPQYLVFLFYVPIHDCKFISV